ncbi:MAG: 4-phosphopantoate--beta-alanine ligase [Nitrososphaerota archaeon]
MSLIPTSHPRAVSLLIREKLVHGFENGLVAKEGLIAHGRGETFDYLLGEKTTKNAKKSTKAAALALILAKKPVISVNGNIAALCAKEILQLARIVDAKIEVNLFYGDKKRKQNIARILRKNGAKEILGLDPSSSRKISGLDSPRRVVDKDGIYVADTVLVPLEDGDRTLALVKAGKKVITFDLNPLSRTAQTADITIVDNVVRGLHNLIRECKFAKNQKIQFDNKKNLSEAIIEIRKNLARRAKYA